MLGRRNESGDFCLFVLFLIGKVSSVLTSMVSEFIAMIFLV